jgi:hypothetical protein
LTVGSTRRDVAACGYDERTALGAVIPTISVGSEMATRVIAALATTSPVLWWHVPQFFAELRDLLPRVSQGAALGIGRIVL